MTTTIDSALEAKGRTSYFASPDREDVFSESETASKAMQSTYQEGFGAHR